MKSLITFSMVLTVMLGLVGVGRLCWDSKWFVILLFLYCLGAFATLSMVAVMMAPKGGGFIHGPRNQKPLQLRPNEREWVVKEELKNTPSFYVKV